MPKGKARFIINLNQAVLNASAGNAKNVIELMEVPTKLKPMTQPANDRPPKKYCSVLTFFLEK
jgi:hypothetical protein